MSACEDCRFYSSGRGGECRRNPPVFEWRVNEDGFQYRQSGWPLVLRTDWCGEFGPKSYRRPT